jgi:hypothetical protein
MGMRQWPWAKIIAGVIASLLLMLGCYCFFWCYDFHCLVNQNASYLDGTFQTLDVKRSPRYICGLGYLANTVFWLIGIVSSSLAAGLFFIVFKKRRHQAAEITQPAQDAAPSSLT